jgi:hypothetical protein
LVEQPARDDPVAVDEQGLHLAAAEVAGVRPLAQQLPAGGRPHAQVLDPQRSGVVEVAADEDAVPVRRQGADDVVELLRHLPGRPVVDDPVLRLEGPDGGEGPAEVEAAAGGEGERLHGGVLAAVARDVAHRLEPGAGRGPGQARDVPGVHATGGGEGAADGHVSRRRVDRDGVHRALPVLVADPGSVRPPAAGAGVQRGEGVRDLARRRRVEAAADGGAGRPGASARTVPGW